MQNRDVTPPPNGRNWFAIENKGSEKATIYIYDEIGLFGISATQFVEALNAIKAPALDLRINSPGGSVFEGITVANAIRRHSAKVTTHIDGVAASIASVVALAGDAVRIADNAFFMIHDPFVMCFGTAEEMRKTADTLDSVAKTAIIAAYTKKTGKTEDEIKAWMAAETWFTADEALAAGFVDAVDKDEEVKNSAGISLFNFKHIPEKIAARIRTPAPAAIGNTGNPPRARGPVQLIKPEPSGGPMLNYAEKVKEYEATRAAKDAQRSAIMAKAIEAGVTLDAAQKEEHELLTDEIAAVDDMIARMRIQEQSNANAAKPIPAAVPNGAVGGAARGSQVVVNEVKLQPGIRMARLARVMAYAHEKHVDLERAVAKLYPDDAVIRNAAVAAGSTSDSDWAGALVSAEGGIAADFVEWLRPQTIIGRFGTGNIPGLRNVPFRRRLVGQTSGATAQWVGEGKAKPLTRFNTESSTLEPLKVATIAVLTQEVVRDSSPSAEALTRDELGAAVRERLDIDFIDPAKIAVANVSPASITNGITAIPSSGNDFAAVRADVKALLAGFIDDNNAPTSGVWIMPSTVALALSLMTNDLGQEDPLFRGITMNGGIFAGLPVITSEYVQGYDGPIVVLVNARDIYLGDEGGFELDMSTEASLEMDDAPSHNSTTPTPTQLVSLWQTNSVGFRAERTINWKRRRESSVQVLEGVNWGAA